MFWDLGKTSNRSNPWRKPLNLRVSISAQIQIYICVCRPANTSLCFHTFCLRFYRSLFESKFLKDQPHFFNIYCWMNTNNSLLRRKNHYNLQSIGHFHIQNAPRHNHLISQTKGTGWVCSPGADAQGAGRALSVCRRHHPAHQRPRAAVGSVPQRTQQAPLHRVP